MALMLCDEGYKVHANYWLDSPNADRITPYQLINMLEGERCEQEETICLHELYAWMSSHRSMSTENELESAIVFQSRKLNINILGDCQLIMRAENSLRYLADFRIEATNEPENERFVYYWLDKKITNADVRTDDCFAIPYSEAEKYWNRYHTYDREKPLGMARMLVEMEKSEPYLALARVEKQVAILIEKGLVPRALTKQAVDYALLRAGEPTTFSPYVLEALRQRPRTIDRPMQQTESLTICPEEEKVACRSPWLDLRKRLGA